MTTIEILVAARELLSARKRWTRYYMARNADGAEIDPRSEKAVCWCLFGAVQKFSPLGTWHHCGALDLVHNVVGRHISGLNDDPNTTHANILRVLDAAIEKAKQDG